MRPIVTDRLAWWSVGLSVGLSVTIVSLAKTAEPIDRGAIWGMDSSGSKKACVKWSALCTWARQLANMTEPSIAVAMRPFCQITLTTCCRYWVVASTKRACLVRHLVVFSCWPPVCECAMHVPGSHSRRRPDCFYGIRLIRCTVLYLLR